MRLDIARYACHHRTTAASFHFSKKLSERVRESTVQCIKKAYLDEIIKMRASGSHELLGRPLLLGEKLMAWYKNTLGEFVKKEVEYLLK